MIRLRAAAIVAGCCLLALPAFAGTKNDPYAMPPNVQAIMKRMQSGQAPSAADQKALSDWSSKMTGQPVNTSAGGGDNAAAAPGGNPLKIEDDSDLSDGEINAALCKKGGHAIGFGAHVTKEQYLATARDARLKYQMKLDPQTIAAMNQTLNGQTVATKGSDLAGMLMARQSWEAAVYAAENAAQRAPGDALTANNLGVALKGLKDYGRAAVALNWAKVLAPNSPMIASNLGSLAIAQHDTGNAKKMYFAALSKNKTMAVPNAELGLMAQCAGKHHDALKYFRASLKGGFSRMAGAGVQSAEGDIWKIEGPDADVGEPMDVSAQAGAGAKTPYWPDPPIASDAKTNVMWQRAGENNPVRLSRLDWEHAIDSNGAIVDSIGIKASVGPDTSVNGSTVVFKRGWEKEAFFADDAVHIAMTKLETVSTRIGKDQQLFQQVNGCLSCAGESNVELKCSVTRPRVVRLYPLYASNMQNDWTNMRKILNTMYQHASPWLSQIEDNNVVESKRAYMDELTATNAMILITSIGNMQAETIIGYMPDDPICGKVGSTTKKTGKLKPYKIDPNKCKIHESMDFGIASFTGDCDKASLEFNIGIVAGAASVKWGKTEAQDQITIFGGIGKSVNDGPLTLGGKAGDYVTFQNGEMIDGGIIASTSGGVSEGPASAGRETTVKYSTVGNNDFGTMRNGVVTGGTVFTQTDSFKIAPGTPPD